MYLDFLVDQYPISFPYLFHTGDDYLLDKSNREVRKIEFYPLSIISYLTVSFGVRVNICFEMFLFFHTRSFERRKNLL